MPKMSEESTRSPQLRGRVSIVTKHATRLSFVKRFATSHNCRFATLGLPFGIWLMQMHQRMPRWINSLGREEAALTGMPNAPAVYIAVKAKYSFALEFSVHA